MGADLSFFVLGGELYHQLKINVLYVKQCM